jgi:hypothetical protein
LKRFIVCIISFFIFFAQTVWAQKESDTQISQQVVSTTNSDYSNASVSIEFYNRTLYYPDNTDSNPILIHITIANHGDATLRFKLADDRMFSIDFTAVTIKNRQLEQTAALIKKRTTNQTVYFREIALESGEEYSFVENAKEFINFIDPSLYYLELKFYPEMYKSKYISLTSNRLTLEVRPSPSAASSTLIPVKEKAASILTPEQIPPDKVVEQTIIARQKSLWDQYFLYMNIEQMLLRDPSRARKYQAVSAEERNRMIESYKADLMQSRIDSDIVAIPEHFEIEKTVYSNTEGTVSVLEWFKYLHYSEKKRYTYYVRNRDGIWQIYDYTVDNLGTE